MLRRPGLRPEGAEGEHGLVEEDDFLLVHLRQLDQRAHADEEFVVLLVGEVDLLLDPLDELELDLVPLVQAPQSGHRNPDLAVAAVEPLDPLLQRCVGPLLQRPRVRNVRHLLWTEFGPDLLCDWNVISQGLDTNLDQVDDRAVWDPGELCDRSIA